MEQSEGTSPVEISLGYVDGNNQCKNGMILKNANGKIVSFVVNHPNVMVASLKTEGLHITMKSI